MADTRGSRKAAPATKKAAVKKAAVKKTAVKKAVPAKKAVPVKKAAPVKKATVKKTAAKKAAARGTNSSRGAEMLAEALAAAAPPPQPFDALPYAPPATAPPPRQVNARMAVIAAVVAVAVLAAAGAAFALTRDKGPTKVKFIATADTVCRPANGPVTAIVKPTSYPELATAAGTVVSTAAGQTTQLKALKRPHGADGKAFEPALTALTATSTAAKTSPPSPRPSR